METILEIAVGTGLCGFISWAAWVTKQIFTNKGADCVRLTRIEQKLDDFISRYDEHLK